MVEPEVPWAYARFGVPLVAETYGVNPASVNTPLVSTNLISPPNACDIETWLVAVTVALTIRYDNAIQTPQGTGLGTAVGRAIGTAATGVSSG